MNAKQHADEALDVLDESDAQYTYPFLTAKVVGHIKAVSAAFEFTPIATLPKSDQLLLVERLDGQQERMMYSKKHKFQDVLSDPANPVTGWRPLL